MRPRISFAPLRTIVRRLLGRALYTERRPYPPGPRSLAIRHLDAGSSNSVELELVALTGPVYDLAQYGIHFVASPRHADVLLISGPLTHNMVAAARASFQVMSEPRWVITAGDFCADGVAARGHDPTGEREMTAIFDASYATVPLPPEMQARLLAHIPGDPPDPGRLLDVLLSPQVDIWSGVPLRIAGDLPQTDPLSASDLREVL